MGSINTEEAARRLARVILSDIELYHRERPKQGETLEGKSKKGASSLQAASRPSSSRCSTLFFGSRTGQREFACGCGATVHLASTAAPRPRRSSCVRPHDSESAHARALDCGAFLRIKPRPSRPLDAPFPRGSAHACALIAARPSMISPRPCLLSRRQRETPAVSQAPATQPRVHPTILSRPRPRPRLRRLLSRISPRPRPFLWRRPLSINQRPPRGCPRRRARHRLPPCLRRLGLPHRQLTNSSFPF